MTLKKFLLVSMGLMAFIFLCSSCQRNTENNDKMQISDSSEIRQQSRLTEWKTSYLDFLQAEKDTHVSYALVYIDDDDIPELYMRGNGEAEGDSVCSYKSGKVIEQKLHRIGGGSYIEKSGVFINQNGHMGNCYTDVFTLTDNEFVLRFSAFSQERFLSLENDEYELMKEYYLEGKPVSENEYNAAIENAFDFEISKPFGKNVVEYDEIKEQIEVSSDI